MVSIAHAPTAPQTRTPRGHETGRGFLGLGLFRSTRRAILGGVAGGLAARLGVDPLVVRAGFALLALNAGAGIVLYLALWLAIPQDDGSALVRAPSNSRNTGVALVVVGCMLLLHAAALWLGNALAWAVGLTIVGAGVMWSRSDDADRARWNRFAGRIADDPLGMLLAGRAAPVRLIAGLVFIAGAVVILLTLTEAHLGFGIVVAVVATIAGAALLVGPWTVRLLRELAEERRERIRSEERSEMAAHLHDSVLQSLALIQRAEDAREMVALARNQERALRAWLSGTERVSGASVAAEIEQMAGEVELRFKVPVDVVTVGDAALDERLTALVDATREAAVNAAKHSAAERISVYLEVEPEVVSAFVRDQGAGFDPAAVAPDRRGITESITGRMHRVSGSAVITSEPGEGTEVQLSVPRDAA